MRHTNRVIQILEAISVVQCLLVTQLFEQLGTEVSSDKIYNN